MRKNNSGNNRNNKNPEKCDNSSMESSFYEDNTQFSSNNNNNNNNNNNSSASSNNNNNNNNNMKRLLSLDLNAKAPAKKQRLNQTAASGASTNTPTPLVLDSPDFQVLKFNTPDIEKFILANTSLQTPTQNLVFPTKVTVTSEQEDYVKGFEEALNSLHNSENSQKLSINSSANALVGGMSGGSVTYTNLDEMPVAIKDEPQTVPNSPPLSPIDMEDQERIKLERKRQRNRVAASKCRKRKLERISKLEDKVKSLKGENAELASLIKKLKEHVCLLKQQVMEHVHAGCTLISTSNLLQVK